MITHDDENVKPFLQKHRGRKSNVEKKIEKMTKLKKVSSEVVALAYGSMSDRSLREKSHIVRDCGSFVTGSIVEDKQTKKQIFKIEHANFCKVRLCPMCQWRRGAKMQTQMIQVFEYINQAYDFGVRYIFMTLTVPNPTADELSEKIDEMQKAWKVLTSDFRKMRRSMRGWYRSLEITHNKKADTYHPHFHAIVAVDADYFTSPDKYITHDELLQAWRDAMDDQTITQVDIRAFKGTSLKQMLKSVQEACKYIAKPSSMIYTAKEAPQIWLQYTADTMEVVHHAIQRRRLIAFGGIIAQARRELGLTSVEGNDADLDDDDTGTAKRIKKISLIWAGGFYQITEIE